MRIIEKRNLWFTLSLGIILLGFSLMGYRLFLHQPVLNWGIDFTGGSTVLIKAIEQPLTTQDIPGIQTVLTALDHTGYYVQLTADNAIIIKTNLITNAERTAILDAIADTVRPIDLLEADTIGPSISQSLKGQSLIMIALVAASLLLYISWRFKFVYGVSALVALLHDTSIILSIAALMAIEINTAFVAAMLMILGYSLNDTIVIFDRIRETRDPDTPLIKTANQAIRNTLRRSVYTSATTAIVILSLLIFGGASIYDFCLVILVGVISGTYSSNLIASPVLVQLSDS